ncbi:MULTISPECIES: hypothetical protein [unclassified Bartonella]|uniref:hypothetical protein n=2 Tax=unclassified Bartonella TaxID=2645622 RepID=UPI0035CF26BB
MVFIDFDPRDRRFISKLEKDLHERRLEKDLLQSIANQRKDKHKLPVFLNAISMNDPYKIGSFSPSPIGSIRPSEIDNEGNKPSPIPQSETPPQLETSPPISTKPVPLQEQPPEPNLSFWDKFSRFSQSDVSKNIDDFLMGAITASPNSSGWQLFAKGLKNLHEGDKQRGQVNQTVEYLKSKGYSEEEARFIAGNRDALNAFLLQKVNGGNRNSQFTNDGRMLVEDPNAPGGYRYIMVEGGKSYEEAERAKALYANNIVRKSILLKDLTYLDEYLKEKGGYATGLIAWIKSIVPGLKENGADKVVKSIKERIASDRIDELKQLSRTGAVGLGNVSDKDLDMLKHSLGELSIDMNVELFTRNLNQIRDVISRLSPEAKAYLLGEDASRSSANQSSQGGSANLPTISSREDIKKLAIGERVSIPDGNYIYDIIRDR